MDQRPGGNQEAVGVDVTRVARSRVARALWFVLGWVAAAVGGVGVVVPGLPTTGFMVLAAACFSRSSPRFERWVLGLPGVGKAVADYRAGHGMPRRAKVVAVVMMVVAVGLSVGLLIDTPVIRIGVAAAGLIAVWYVVWRVPTAAEPASGSGTEPAQPS